MKKAPEFRGLLISLWMRTFAINKTKGPVRN